MTKIDKSALEVFKMFQDNQKSLEQKLDILFQSQIDTNETLQELLKALHNDHNR